ncbi:43939_t:CDS:2, partial [Gigaspora margarita]
MNDSEIKNQVENIVKSHLPEETIKEKIGELKEAKGQRVEP